MIGFVEILKQPDVQQVCHRTSNMTHLLSFEHIKLHTIKQNQFLSDRLCAGQTDQTDHTDTQNIHSWCDDAVNYNGCKTLAGGLETLR